MHNKQGDGPFYELPASDELLGPNSQIANQLRAFYTSIQEETIPDRFLDLLEKLDQVEAGNHTQLTRKAGNE